MVARVADDLRRGVEAHGLAVEQRRGEDVGMDAFDPSGDVDQEREARRMRQREAVIAEALDLVEAAAREIGAVAVGAHAGDEFFLENVDIAVAAKGGHGAAQAIRLAAGEASADHGDLHRLLLEERHAQRALQHLFEARRIIVLLQPHAAAQIGMHHVALDRTGPDDRHFDDEVEERPGLEAWQHAHLRAALDLEDADRIGVAEHVVHLGPLARHGRNGVAHPVMTLDQVEGAVDATQHAKAQDIDLEDLEGVEIILVPFDDGAILHRRILDRHQLVERAACDDEAADMLREMARKAHKLLRQVECLPQGRVGRIEPRLAHLLKADAIAAPAPYHAGQRRRDVLGEAHHLADLSDGAARAVGADHSGEAGAVAAVFAVDVLDHLLALLMLKIDVDVWRLVALAADEALEQEVDVGGIDIGDAEAIAHGRIRRRAAPLAQDLLAAGEVHDVVHGEEVGGKAQLADELQLMRNLLGDLLRHACRIAPRRPFPSQALELLLRRHAVGTGLVGIFVAQLGEAKAAALDDLHAACHRAGMIAEQPLHLDGRFQVSLGIGREAEPGLGDGAAFADAGDDVLQPAAFPHVVEHVVAGDERQAGAVGERGEAMEALRVISTIEMLARDIGAVAEIRRDALQEIGEAVLRLLRRQRDHHLARAMLDDIGARTTPASVLRSAMAMAPWPISRARSTSSAGCEAPRRKEKLVVTCSSA